jgi:hypothetical protein
VKQLLLTLLLLLSPCLSRAVCHVITPAGSGTKSGADWNNACADFTVNCAPTSYVRGDTYYMAAGGYAAFDMPPIAGTALITIKGATSADHCTNTGYTNSTMSVEIGQADLTPSCNTSACLYVTGSHYVLDGNTGTLNGHHGIVFTRDLPGNGTGWIRFGNGGSLTLTDITLQHIEFNNVNAFNLPDTTCANAIFYISQDTVSNFAIKFGYFHDAKGDFATFANPPISNFTYSNNWEQTDRSTGSCHSEGFAFWGGTNITFSYNTFVDIAGSAVIFNLENQATNLYVYGNLWYSPAGSSQSVGTGFVSDNITVPDGPIVNAFIFNNTIANVPNSTNAGITMRSAASSNWDVKNNLWYNTGPISQNAPHDFNTFLNVGTQTFNLGANEFLTASGSASPFVSTTDYRLTSETVDPHLNDGTNTNALLAANGTDVNGITRGADGTWERGTFEFQISGPGVLFSPASLSFGNQTVNTTSANQETTLTNSGTTALTITSISLSGADTGDFALPTSSSPCPISPSTLAASATCTIRVTFMPLTTGARSASVSVVDNAAGSPHTVPLTGTGTGAGGGNKGCQIVGSAILVKGTCQ